MTALQVLQVHGHAKTRVTEGCAAGERKGQGPHLHRQEIDGISKNR